MPGGAGFRVRLPTFEGSLAELAQALRSGALAPKEVALSQLVHDYLAYYRTLGALEPATEALPLLARVIELKALLLLPQPPPEESAEADIGKTLEAVALLAELEAAVAFLRRRRDQRRLVIPAAAPRPDYPRPTRAVTVGAGQLAELAARRLPTGYFELARERLSVTAAMQELLVHLKALGSALFSRLLTRRDWAFVAVAFAGLLELIRQGKVRASQTQAYGEITVSLVAKAAEREAA